MTGEELERVQSLEEAPSLSATLGRHIDGSAALPGTVPGKGESVTFHVGFTMSITASAGTVSPRTSLLKNHAAAPASAHSSIVVQPNRPEGVDQTILKLSMMGRLCVWDRLSIAWGEGGNLFPLFHKVRAILMKRLGNGF